ncbi:MAG: TrgA family protein [Pseudomonadota bacterium]
MPTIGRVVGALTFAAAAYYVSTLVQELFLEERQFPNLAVINAVLGIIVGWRLAGGRAGQGWNAALGYWLTTTIGLAFVCLFANAFGDMIRRSMRMQYDGPLEGITDIAAIMWEYGGRIATPEIILTALGAGLAAALVTEFFGRRYP